MFDERTKQMRDPKKTGIRHAVLKQRSLSLQPQLELIQDGTQTMTLSRKEVCADCSAPGE